MEPLEEISHTPNMQEKSHPTLQTQPVATHWSQSTLQMDNRYVPTVRYLVHQQNTQLRSTHFPIGYTHL